jgi:hypothetical protein
MLKIEMCFFSMSLQSCSLSVYNTAFLYEDKNRVGSSSDVWGDMVEGL